jgi:hypothetical protein
MDDNKKFSDIERDKITKRSRREKLQGDNLHFALGEMIYFIMKGVETQKDALGLPQPLGFFTGGLFKKNMIEVALTTAFRRNNIPLEQIADLTFKKLAEYNVNGKPLFRPFYIMAFNTGIYRTEIFSFEHTPNVHVIDAVLASMSIPIFFTPKEVKENSKIRQMFTLENKPESAHYLDGGITDNFPIWIFDDLKYCLRENELPYWNAKKKIFIHNPRTLGFKLLDSDRIDLYLHPYYNNDPSKLKRIATMDFSNSLGYFIGSVGKGLVSLQEEGQHIHRFDCARTSYVDNLGISPVNFNMTLKEKEDLIISGKNAVKKYKERAVMGFIGEGEYYPERFHLQKI